MACRRMRECSDLEDVAVVSLARQFAWRTAGSILGFASPPCRAQPERNLDRERIEAQVVQAESMRGLS